MKPAPKIAVLTKGSKGLGTELVSNGGFETGSPPTDWVAGGDGSATLSTSTDVRTGATGTKSLDIAIGTGKTSGGASGATGINTTAKHVYRVDCYFKNVNLATGIRVVIFDSDWNILATSDYVTGAWVESTFTFVAATAVSNIFIQGAGTATQHGIVDDLSIREVLNP